MRGVCVAERRHGARLVAHRDRHVVDRYGHARCVRACVLPAADGRSGLSRGGCLCVACTLGLARLQCAGTRLPGCLEAMLNTRARCSAMPIRPAHGRSLQQQRSAAARNTCVGRTLTPASSCQLSQHPVSVPVRARCRWGAIHRRRCGSRVEVRLSCRGRCRAPPSTMRSSVCRHTARRAVSPPTSAHTALVPTHAMRAPAPRVCPNGVPCQTALIVNGHHNVIPRGRGGEWRVRRLQARASQSARSHGA